MPLKKLNQTNLVMIIIENVFMNQISALNYPSKVYVYLNQIKS